MRNQLKIVLIFFLTILIILLFATEIYGWYVTTTTTDDEYSDWTTNDFKPNAKGSTKLEKKAGKIIGVIQTVGSVTSVVVLVSLGIKYMAGSIEEKAQYKKTMLPYLIGAILVFTASSITGIIYDIAQGL